MSTYEALFFWTAVCLYAVTSALCIYALVFKNDRVFGAVPYLIAVSLLFHTATALARYAAVGNLPVAGDYENSVGLTWFIVAITLYLSIRRPALRPVSAATMPLTFLLLGYGVMQGPKLMPMAASVRSIWLYLHVLFAWLAFGAYAVASGLSVLYLKKEKSRDRPLSLKLPELPALDELVFRYVIFGFITDAVMIGAGAIWAKDLWGSYWSWDPIETWSLVTWLLYGLVIHLRVTLGWRGKRLAWIVLFALSGMIITYFGINWFVKSTLHVFDAGKGII